MNPTLKLILTYIVIAFFAMGLTKACDWLTKKPVPVDRTEDPEITALNKRIDAVLDSVAMYKKQSSDDIKAAKLSLDSIRIDHKKSNNEHIQIHHEPDSNLKHIRDSIRANNGL